MIKGDISNETPPRILVNLDYVLKRTVEGRKFLGIFNSPRRSTEYDVQALNILWRYRDKASVTLELFVAYWDQEWDENVLEEVHHQIDEYGTNPFSYYTTWRTFKEALAILPYRNEVAGVIDPERSWTYGSKALDVNRLI